MLRRDMGRHQPDRGGQHRSIVGETEHRQHVLNEVDRQAEIGDGTKKPRLDMGRRLRIEGTVNGAGEILGERQPGCDPLELGPEALANALRILGQPIRRLKSDRILRNHCPRSFEAQLGCRAALASSCKKAPGIASVNPSVADLTFASLLPRVLQANVKPKATLRIQYFASVPLVNELPATGYECQNRDTRTGRRSHSWPWPAPRRVGSPRRHRGWREPPRPSCRHCATRDDGRFFRPPTPPGS